MSKGNSGLFSKSTANATLLLAITYKAINNMISNTKGGNRKSMAVGAYDSKTGRIATAFAGNIPDKIHPELLKRAKEIGGIVSKGLTDRNTVGVCAEFHAINSLLLSGSNLSDIRLTKAIRPRTGKIQPFCANCLKMFADIIKLS